MDYVNAGGLRVARSLYDFVNTEAIPGTNTQPTAFWHGFSLLIRDLAPLNRELLARREALQCKIDAWHRENRGKPVDIKTYVEFLQGIGYLQPEPGDVTIG